MSFRRQKNKQYIETDFLSGIESILAARLSVAAWFIPLALMLLVIGLIVWAWHSEVDVVASAIGEIVPSQEVQLIQPKDVGIVKTILVTNGDRVGKGQLLVELEDQNLQGQLLNTQEQLRQLAIDLAILSRQKQCFDTDQVCAATIPLVAELLRPLLGAEVQNLFANLSSERLKIAQSLLIERWNNFLAQRQLRQNQLGVLKTQLKQKEAAIYHSQDLLPLYKKRLDRVMELNREQLAAGAKVEEAEEQMMEQQQNLINAQLEKDNLIAQIEVSQSELHSFIHETKTRVSDEWFTKLSEFRSAITSQQQLLRLLAEKSLISPVAGKVFDRSIATEGGVVQSAQILMKVLPTGTVLQAKVNILNKDRGFIEVGDAVAIKVDAYPFTKHGSIEGEVASISSAAILDEQLGAVYPAIVNFISMNVTVNKQPAPIIPGMSVTADIYQGKRLLAEYVLAPLLRHKEESLRER